MSIPWDVIIGEGAKAAIKSDLFSKLLTLFKHKHKILVLGASGVGKTQLVRALKDDIVESIPASERTSFTEKTKIIFDGLPFLFVDTPGHIYYQSTRQKAIQSAIRTGVSGILNVVCYGYHEGVAKARDAISKSGIAKSEYLKKGREMEVDRLSEWVPLIDKDVVDWVITVITKADLWWPASGEIYAHYTEGSYRKMLGNLPILVQHTVLPYCSIIEPFYGHRVSGKLGNRDKQHMHNYFLNTLLSAVGKTR